MMQPAARVKNTCFWKESKRSAAAHLSRFANGEALDFSTILSNRALPASCFHCAGTRRSSPKMIPRGVASTPLLEVLRLALEPLSESKAG